MSLPLLSQKIAPYLETDFRVSLVDQFRQLPEASAQLGVQTVLSLFSYRLSLGQHEFADLWLSIFASYQPLASQKGGDTNKIELDIASTAERFSRRRSVLHRRAGKSLMRWYESVFANQFFNGNAVSEETPLAYTFRHVVSLLLIDFAVCSHQRMDGLLLGESEFSTAEQREFQKHVVDVITQVGRTMLHTKQFTRVLPQFFYQQTQDPLTLLVTLLKAFESQSIDAIRLNPIAAAIAR